VIDIEVQTDSKAYKYCLTSCKS